MLEGPHLHMLEGLHLYMLGCVTAYTLCPVVVRLMAGVVSAWASSSEKFPVVRRADVSIQ